MFKWNVLLDLSGEAATKSFGTLSSEFSLKVLLRSIKRSNAGNLSPCIRLE